MKADEVLLCGTCHTEARVVRVGKSLLVLGHRVNPRQNHHPVTLPLSRSADDRYRKGPEEHRRQSVVREDAPPSSRRTNGTRPASDGSSRTATPSGTLQSSAERQTKRYPSTAPGVPLRAGRRPRSTAGPLVTDRTAIFWAAVDKSAGLDACWPWLWGVTPKGYGDGRFAGQRTAHRAAWVFTHGPIPDGKFVLHTCDNRVCCNPAHLYLGTNADNMRDMVSRGRSPRQMRPSARCRSGLHEMTPDNVDVPRDGRRRCRACRLQRERGAA